MVATSHEVRRTAKHNHRRAQHYGQIYLLQLIGRHPHFTCQNRWQGHKKGHQHRMQHKHPAIEVPQPCIAHHRSERRAIGPHGLPAGSKSGTPHTANRRHKKPNKLITQNSPESPNCPTITGEITKDKAKDKPMDMPIMAMARVRTSGREIGRASCRERVEKRGGGGGVWGKKMETSRNRAKE